ncbi:MAG: PAS domain S-box protein [Methylobacterium frigidaeris]
MSHSTPRPDGDARPTAGDPCDGADAVLDQCLGDVAVLARDLCGTEAAALWLIAGDALHLGAEVGPGRRGMPVVPLRGGMLRRPVLLAADVEAEPGLAAPLLAGAPAGLRLCAGARIDAADGDALGLLCVLDPRPRDLSERQVDGLMRLARQAGAQIEARRALRMQGEEQRWQERILESAVDHAIMAMDRNGRVTRWNEGARRILGWSEEEMRGRRIDAIFTPEDCAAGRPEVEMRQALEEGSAPDERWHLRRSGERFWALGEMMPLRAEDGTPTGFLKILRDRTEQRRSETALRDSERRFEALSELAPAIIWQGRPDGGLSAVNDRWPAYSGQSAEEAVPFGWTAAVHPHDLPALLALWQDARSDGTLYEAEARLRRHDGTYRWFLIRAEPQRDANGTVVGWLGSNNDIHDRRRAEEALHKAEDQLRLAVEATGIGIFDYDLVANDLVWDDRVRALFGLPPGAPVGYDTFLDGVHAEDRARVHEAVERAVDPAGPGLFDVEYRTVGLVDGIERWVAALGQAIVERGRSVRFVGTVRDVTARRRAEDELRATEERYRLASRATNDAIWDWDFASNHVLWNEALQAAYGYRPEQIEPTGDWWIGHIHPCDRDRIDASIHAVIDGRGEHWNDEYRFLRADGSYADILDRGYVIRDARGRAVRMIGAMFDISPRKRAEERQQLLTSELQHRVKNTLALVQAIASQTFRNATDLDSTREAFAARLISLGRAHDILTQASWTAAPVADVVAGALGVHRDAGSPRIRVGGPDVPLAAKSSLSLALVLHELATNAAKYGALSNEAGHVEVHWHVIDETPQPRFCLIWSEHDGPPVVPPKRKGFGSRLIERSFAAETGGSVRLTYEPSGVRCRLEAPLGLMQDQPDAL